jgi:DNA-binding NarL/FixJ family response regulator
VAQGLRALIQAHHDVLDIVCDARAVPDALLRYRPDLVLLDLSMPHVNGLELLPLIKRTSPSTRVLVVTMHLDRAFADLALSKGALGFVPKEASAVELHDAIAAVLAGRRHVSPRVPLKAYRDSEAMRAPALERLTPRQREILRLTAQGLTAAETGDVLGLSQKTIEFHRSRIRHLLGVPNEWAMVRLAVMAGLVTAEAAVVPPLTTGEDPERPPGQDPPRSTVD